MGAMRINRKWLLAIYAVMPIGIVVAVVDYLFFDASLRTIAPKKLDDLILFTLVLTLPHILASFFGLLDREYVGFYGKKLLRGVQLAVLVSVLLPAINITAAFYFFAVHTMIHVFFQQAGIAKSLLRKASTHYSYWQWLGAAISIAIYIMIYTNYALTGYVLITMIVLGLAYTYVGFLTVSSAADSLAKRYFWLTHATPLFGLVCLMAGLPILAIIVPRLIHDITAFTFYITHDSNRFKDRQTNVLYKTADRLSLPVVIASPVLAVGITVAVQQVSGSVYAGVFLMAVFLYHYYVEGFIWKRDSLHRRYIKYR